MLSDYQRDNRTNNSNNHHKRDPKSNPLDNSVDYCDNSCVNCCHRWGYFCIETKERQTKDDISKCNNSVNREVISGIPKKGSITDDIDRYHNRFIQSGNESTATTKTSVKSEAKAKRNKGIRSIASPPNSPTKAKISKKQNKH